MTDSARMANLASFAAIVVLSLTALAASNSDGSETAAGPTVAGTASPEVNGVVIAADEIGAPGDGIGGGAVEIDAGGAPVVVHDPDAGRRGLIALDAIDYPWMERLPGWQMSFHRAETGAYGYTLPEEQRIEIYVRADQSNELLAHVIAHELGHAIDVTHNDGNDRERWQEARGIPEAPWWPDDRAADFATGAGDFAESFAASLLGDGSFRSELGDPPSAEQVDLLATLSGG